MDKDLRNEELEAMQDFEEEPEVIAMADEEGNESQYLVDMYLNIGDKTYVVMYKLNENGDVEEEDAYAFRAVFVDEELERLEELTDEEIVAVGEKYEEICKAQEE